MEKDLFRNYGDKPEKKNTTSRGNSQFVTLRYQIEYRRNDILDT